MLTTLALLALAAPQAQADIRIAVEVGGPIPGGGRVAFIGDFACNERGQVLALVASANQVPRLILDDDLLLSKFIEIEPGIEFLGGLNVALNDDGHWAAYVLTSVGEGLVVDGTLIARAGLPLAPDARPGLPAGTILADDGYGYQGQSLRWSGSTLCLSVDTVAAGVPGQAARRLFYEVNESTGDVVLDRATAPGEVITSEGHTFSRSRETVIASDGSVSEFAWVDDPSGTGTILISVAGEVVLRDGDPSPVPGTNLSLHPGFTAGTFGDEGQWAASVVHVQNGPFDRIHHLYRDGHRLLSAGDPAPDGSQRPIYNDFFAPHMAKSGALLYQVRYTDPLEPSGTVGVIMLDDVVALSTKRDRLPDGRTFGGVWLGFRQHAFASNGTLFAISLFPNDTGDRAIAVVEVAPGSPSDCDVATNSTGSIGRIEATGSAFLDRGGLTLRAYNLPSEAFGHVIASRTPGFVPMAGGSQGTLCLGGSVGRMIPANPNSGPGGELFAAMDLAQLPQPTGSVGATVGETWFFQFWHRDVGPVAPTSNLTQAYRVLIK